MAKAKVTLNDNGPLTWHGNGVYSFERGQSAIITKDSDIAFFLAEPGFTVDFLEGSRPKTTVDEDDEPAPASKPKKAAKPAKAAKSVPPPADEDADDSDDEAAAEDGEGDDEDDDDEEEVPADGELNEAELKKLNKNSLMELIEEKGLKADASMKNKQLIAIILASAKS